MARNFDYTVALTWTGNDGTGTSTRSFGRDSEMTVPLKPTLIGSAPAEFGGDGRGWAPEDLLVAALSECHMLTYLFMASRAGIVVESYSDEARGTLTVDGASGGRFTEVVLSPRVVISTGDPTEAEELHARAHAGCYIGSSVNFPVVVEPTTLTSS